MHVARISTAPPLIAAIIAVVLGVLLCLQPATPASRAAATTVDGQMVDFQGWTVGTRQLSSGAFVYCIEPGAFTPVQSQLAPTVVSELRAYAIHTRNVTGWDGMVTSSVVHGEPLRRINYLLATHGDAPDADAAVAVQFAVWMLRDSPGEAAWLAHHVAWVERHGGRAHMDRARDLVADAIANAHAPTPPHMADPQLHASTDFGAGSVTYPAGTTELRISGARFLDGTTTFRVTDGGAGQAAWEADLHPAGWQRTHLVRVTGDWEAPAAGWPALVEIYPSAVPTEQTLSWAVGPVTEPASGSFSLAEVTLDAQFQPQLTTRVHNRWVGLRAQPFTDVVTLTAAVDAAPWPSRRLADGALTYAPVTAEGILYGPFTQPQLPSPLPPQGAPVAASVTLVADRGPGAYVVPSPVQADESGYYYWVWSIHATAQDDEVRAADLIPASYAYSDDFGLEAEGHVVPTRLRWTTALTEHELTPTRLQLTDRVHVTLHEGAWLRDMAGERVPARLRLTVYQSDREPVRQSTVPANAQEVGRAFVEVSAPFQRVTSPVIDLPAGTRGWVTIQTCLIAEDQPLDARGLVEEWCDDYGIPAETAAIRETAALATTGFSGAMMGLAWGLGLLVAGAAALAFAARTRHIREASSRHERDS